MRMTRAEAKRIALNKAARRAAAQKAERRVRDGLAAVAIVQAAPVAPRMSRRRLKAWRAGEGAPS